MSPRRDPAGQCLCDLRQQRVAQRVAVSVVDAFQVVDVDHQQGGVRRVAGRPGELAFRGLEEAAPVERPGQIVGLSQLRQPGASSSVVEHQGGCVCEPGNELELLTAEIGFLAIAVDAERPGHPAVRDERHPE